MATARTEVKQANASAEEYEIPPAMQIEVRDIRIANLERQCRTLAEGYDTLSRELEIEREAKLLLVRLLK